MHEPNDSLSEPQALRVSEASRRDYLAQLLTDFPERRGSVDAWARETAGLGAAQLIELVFSVCVLGNAFSDTAARLRCRASLTAR